MRGRCNRSSNDIAYDQLQQTAEMGIGRKWKGWPKEEWEKGWKSRVGRGMEGMVGGMMEEQGRRKDGREGGRKDARKDGRVGSEEGWKGGWEEGWKSWAEGRVGGRMGGRMVE